MILKDARYSLKSTGGSRSTFDMPMALKGFRTKQTATMPALGAAKKAGRMKGATGYVTMVLMRMLNSMTKTTFPLPS